MKMKSLSAALLAAGVTAVGTAGAFNLTPNWFKPIRRSLRRRRSRRVTRPRPSFRCRRPKAWSRNYRAIVKQAGPAVVGVSVAGTHTVSAEERGLPPGMEDDPFFRFFRGMPGMPGAQQRGNNGVPFKGMGSGFIISADGLILTNAHVVREAKDVTVKLSDRREYTAKVLGIDTTTDIAVLRIDAKDLPTVQLGDARQLEVGDPVLAIGAPYGSSRARRRASSVRRAARCPATRWCRSSRPTRR
jgi:serine protease Do